MKKSAGLAVSCALCTIGIASMIYSYVQMNPSKAKKMAKDMKDMMKDL